jgi:hypothetical protein
MPLFPQTRLFTWRWKLAISNTFLAASLVFGNHCEHQSRLAILHDRVQVFWTWSSILACQHKWSISYRFGPAHNFRRTMIHCSSLQNKLFWYRDTFTSRCLYGDKGNSKNMQIGLPATHPICNEKSSYRRVHSISLVRDGSIMSVKCVSLIFFPVNFSYDIHYAIHFSENKSTIKGYWTVDLLWPWWV